MKQNHIFVLDKCEINVEQIYWEQHVDLHKLRKSKSFRLCPSLPYTGHFKAASQ